jgi:hypothetical protein
MSAEREKVREAMLLLLAWRRKGLSRAQEKAWMEDLQTHIAASQPPRPEGPAT